MLFVASIRQKKLIACYQAAANRGESIDADALEKKQELTSELETYRNYHQELSVLTEKILREGGVQIIWRMN